jgi:hypothetical protein
MAVEALRQLSPPSACASARLEGEARACWQPVKRERASDRCQKNAGCVCRLHRAAACDVEREPAARIRGCGRLPEQLLYAGQLGQRIADSACAPAGESAGLNRVCGRGSLRAYAALMNEASAALIARLDAAAAAGAPIDVHAALGDMTMQVVGSTAFGRAPRLLLARQGGAAATSLPPPSPVRAVSHASIRMRSWSTVVVRGLADA